MSEKYVVMNVDSTGFLDANGSIVHKFSEAHQFESLPIAEFSAAGLKHEMPDQGWYVAPLCKSYKDKS